MWNILDSERKKERMEQKLETVSINTFAEFFCRSRKIGWELGRNVKYEIKFLPTEKDPLEREMLMKENGDE